MGRGNPRTAFTGVAAVFIGYNVLVSVIGLIANCPTSWRRAPRSTRSPSGRSSTETARLCRRRCWPWSPPHCCCGSTRGRLVIACACTTVLTLVTAVASLDEVEGFSPRPIIYSAAKWDFAIVLGVIFAVIGVAVVVSGIWYLVKSIRLALRSRDRGRPAQTAPRSDVHS